MTNRRAAPATALLLLAGLACKSAPSADQAASPAPAPAPAAAPAAAPPAPAMGGLTEEQFKALHEPVSPAPAPPRAR